MAYISVFFNLAHLSGLSEQSLTSDPQCHGVIPKIEANENKKVEMVVVRTVSGSYLCGTVALWVLVFQENKSILHTFKIVSTKNVELYL